MDSKIYAIQPEGLSLGDQIQEKAVVWNNSTKHPVIGFIGARAYTVICKPPARILDVTLHIMFGVGKVLIGITITAPLSFFAKLIRGKNLDTNWTVKQGMYHFGYAALYTVDIFVSPLVNLISPNIYPTKKILDLQNQILDQQPPNQPELERRRLRDIQAARLQVRAEMEQELQAAMAELNRTRNSERTSALAAQEQSLLRRLAMDRAAAQETLQRTNQASQRTLNELRDRYEQQLDSRAAELSNTQDQLLQTENALGEALTEVGRLVAQNEQLNAQISRTEAEEVIILEDLERVTVEFNRLPPPPPPPPSLAVSEAYHGAEGITGAALESRKQTLKLNVRRYLWKDSKHVEPNDSRFRIWAAGKIGEVNRALAQLNALRIKIEDYQAAPLSTEFLGDYEILSRIKDDIKKQESRIIERELNKLEDTTDAFIPAKMTEAESDEEEDWEEEVDIKQTPLTELSSLVMHPKVEGAETKEDLLQVLEDLSNSKYQQIQRSLEYLRTNLNARDSTTNNITNSVQTTLASFLES